MTKAPHRQDDLRMSSSRAPVLFNGAWTDEGQRVVEDAALDIERRRRRPSSVPLMGQAWVCNCHEVQEALYFMAHWSRRPGTVLIAHTAAELSEKMLRLACSAPEEAEE